MQSSKIRDNRMAGGKRILVVLTAVLCILTAGWTGATGSAEAEASAERQAARDITRECRITPASKKKEFSKALDNNYKTYWNSAGGKLATIDIQAPKGENIGAVWFQW
ncbi:MAG: hypothetical protein IKE25_10100, partial [Clostridia bacterium]|nr:hypothetical protein [Clostridia bacterium]